MTSRRIIPGVLHNFLETFTSRYSDYDGYWVFGFLVEEIEVLRIDLLAEVAACASSRPLDFVHRLASQRFSEQIAKAGLPRAWFRDGWLDLTKSPGSSRGFVNGQSSTGYIVRFQAQIVTDLGRTYGRTASMFIAPHDPKIELRSARAV